MDERMLRKVVMLVPFSYPLVEGTTIHTNSSDPKLKIKCFYLTVIHQEDNQGIEVFIRPDTSFVVTRATYHYSTYDMKVSRQISGDSVPYAKLPDFIGAENMRLIDDRLSYYLLKSL